MKNNIEHQYLKLLDDILHNGVEKKDRTGTGTHSVFGRQIRHKMSEGYPLLTTKKMAFKTMVTELLWFLKGDTNIKYLVDNGCNIWNGDAYKKYRQDIDEWVNQLNQEEFINKIKTDNKFAARWGDLGPIYGKQWRKWNGDDFLYGNFRNGIDQIQNLINDLKTNPDSRRLMVNAWNVGELKDMVLPPCHYGFQVYTRELSFEERWELAKRFGYVVEDATIPSVDDQYSSLNAREELNSMWNDKVLKTNLPTRAISLMWNQRSVDTFLGLPFNIASYGLLLEIIAKEVNMVPDELIGNLGDVHLYSNHIEQAKEQMYREPMKLPKLNELPNYLCMKDDWECDKPSDITLDNYQSHPTIKAPLSN